MKRIPWCVVLTMINDVGRLRRKEKTNHVMLRTREEELKYFGLI